VREKRIKTVGAGGGVLSTIQEQQVKKHHQLHKQGERMWWKCRNIVH
jgi:hypothetical protein